MRLRREKTGDAVGRPTWRSSFLDAPIATFSGQKQNSLNFVSTCLKVVDTRRGDATIKAWTMSSPDHREMPWTVHEKANSGEIRERFLRLTAWGCCDAPNVHAYYSLLSGRKLYVTNFDLLEIRGKGDGPLAARFVGFGYDVNDLGRDPSLAIWHGQRYGSEVLGSFGKGILRNTRSVWNSERQN
jgi:hypothetical protein